MNKANSNNFLVNNLFLSIQTRLLLILLILPYHFDP